MKCILFPRRLLVFLLAAASAVFLAEGAVEAAEHRFYAYKPFYYMHVGFDDNHDDTDSDYDGNLSKNDDGIGFEWYIDDGTPIIQSFYFERSKTSKSRFSYFLGWRIWNKDALSTTVTERVSSTTVRETRTLTTGPNVNYLFGCTFMQGLSLGHRLLEKPEA